MEISPPIFYCLRSLLNKGSLTTILSMTPTALSLLDLPPELILEIVDYLPADGILALKLTHRVLDSLLPLASLLRKQTLSRCARLAVRGLLAKPTPNPTHLRCLLCKTVYPVKTFSSSSSPACAPLPAAAAVKQTEIIELPQRVCAWHVGRLVRIVRTDPGGRNEWVDKLEEMCMHCGAVQSWAKCGCTCNSCSVRTVTTYTRYLNNRSECRTFVFYRKPVNDSGVALHATTKCQLFVRETCDGPGMYLELSRLSIRARY